MTDAPVSLPSAQPPGAPPASGLAIGALVCGSVGALLALVGICTFGITAALGIIVGIVGLILSIMAIRRIRRSAGQMGGRGLAVGGLITSIVAIVLGLLIALAMGAFIFFAVEQTQAVARIDTTKLKMMSIETALEAYNINIGHYPDELEGGLDALRIKPAFNNQQLAEQWQGPYLKEEPRDSWGNKFNYRVTRAGTSEAGQTPYRLWSNGPDGMDGTDDDITNRPEVP